jgi:hypothetical protein
MSDLPSAAVDVEVHSTISRFPNAAAVVVGDRAGSRDRLICPGQGG